MRVTPASLPRTGQATLMASGSTGADMMVDNTIPLDRLVKSILPGVGSQLCDVRNKFTLLTTTSLSYMPATGKQSEAKSIPPTASDEYRFALSRGNDGNPVL